MKKNNVLKAAVATGIVSQCLAGFVTAKDIQLEEVIVSAQKRDERLTDVPISIASVSSESIEQTGVRQLKDVAEYVPNLTISSGTDFTSSVNIRGVGANSRNIGFDTRVGVYVDGVYLGQSPALNQELLDLERIEVLRGPQGTLFGKNTVAGAINLISKKPSDELEGSIGIEYGNYSSRQISAFLNVPVSDEIAAKISLNKQERDGTVENVVTGNDVNELDGQSYRVQLRYMPSDNFEANVVLDNTKTDRLSYTGDAITNTFGSALDTVSPAVNQVNQTIDPREERDIGGLAVTLDWALANDFSIKSITAYRETEIFYKNDSDYAAFDLSRLSYTDKYDQFSQEIQFISPDEGALKYVAGLYYYDQQGDTFRQLLNTPLGQVLLGLDPNSPITVDGVVDTLSIAAFLNGSYVLSDRLTLGFGVRYSKEDKDVNWLIDGSGGPAFALATGTLLDSRTDNNVSPTVSLTYALDDNSSVYAKYSSGYKSGGYNLDFVTTAAFANGLEFDKETVDSYEIGLKGTILDNSLFFSLAAFQSVFDDYQVNQFVQTATGGTVATITNAAEVETKGFEAELTYKPNGYLQFMASVGVLDAEFTRFPGGGLAGADVSGNSLSGVGDYSASLGIQYYYPIAFLGAELLARLDYTYQDDYFTDVNNERTRQVGGAQVQFGHVDSVSLVNARLGLYDDNTRWSAALWGRNLTDEEYLTNTVRDFLGTLVHFHGTPRTYGVELEYSF